MTEKTDHDDKISLLLLLAIAEKIVVEYGQRGLATVDLGDRQYYHAVAASEMFDMTRIPQDLCVGDLCDDIAELKRLIHDDMPTAVDIERLGNVLIAISKVVLD